MQWIHDWPQERTTDLEACVRDHEGRAEDSLMGVIISAFVLLVEVSPLCLKRATITQTEHEIASGMCGQMWVCPHKHPKPLHHNDGVDTHLQKPVHSFLDERLQLAKYRQKVRTYTRKAIGRHR